MSKLNKFSNITEQDIKKHGVQALADRPNASGQYGTGGLSAQQLKEWFDQLAAIIAGKLNEIQNVLGGKSAASYIAATLQGSRYESLQDILDAMTDGNLQYYIKVRDIVVPNWPDHEDAEMVSLNQLVSSISFGLETLFERVLKVYALDPIGEINFRIGSNNDDTDISLELWGAPLGRDDNDDELKVIASVKLQDILNSFPKPIVRREIDIEHRIISGRHIKEQSIESDNFAPGAVDQKALGAGAVNETKIAPGSIMAEHMKDGAVTETKLSSSVSEKLNTGYRHALDNVEYVPTTGELIFRSVEGKELGRVDLPLELIVKSGYVDDTKGSEAIVLTLANGEEIRIPVEVFAATVVDQIKVAEAARVEAENKRVEAENARSSAEKQRADAEATRQQNEADRQMFYEEFREGLDNISDKMSVVEDELGRVASEHEKLGGRVSRNEKHITNLEKGLMADAFETDASVAYVKDVPTNALPCAAVAKVGGMTHKDGETLKNAKVTEIESVGANIIPFPFYLTGTREISGVTFTVNDNQSITLNGTVSASNGVPIGTIDGTKLSPGSYYASLDTTLPTGCTFYSSSTGTSTFTWIPSGGKNNVVTIPQGSWMLSNTAFQVRLWIEKGATFNNVTIYPFIAKSDVAVPYAPYAKHTLPIPAEVKALDGYGEGIDADHHNRIVWEDGQYRKEVAEIRLPSSVGGYGASDNWYYIGLASLGISVNAGTRTVLCNMLPSANIKSGGSEEGICINAERTHILIRKNDFTTQAEYKQWLTDNEVIALYALATPEITDISDILTADNMLPVEGGGTITAVNEHAFAVPTEIMYQLKEE